MTDRQFIADMWDNSGMPTLKEYIPIRCVSAGFEPDWKTLGYMHQAAKLLNDWVDRCGVRGLSTHIVELPDRTPTVFCEVAGSAPGTALLYGHYDKQPAFDDWADGLSPWKPVQRNGRLYGRGGADDGYAVFAALTAIAALQEQGLPHPRCIVLIEGSEESGSPDLPFYLDKLAEDIGAPDLVVCLDAECGNYDQLWINTSIRGMLLGTLTVRVLTEGVHSGVAGGIVPSSFRLLRQLIERVEDATTGQLIEALHVPISDATRQQALQVASVLGAANLGRFPWAGSTNPGDVAADELVLSNTWRPSLEVVGLDGCPAIRDAGNTLRPLTAAKLAFRLPPTLDANHAAAIVKNVMENERPYEAQVCFALEAALAGWAAPSTAGWLATALEDASQAHFGASLMRMSTGGTIPFMKMLGDRFADVQFFVTGVLGPHSNAHGPNEFLHIDTAKRVTACVAHALLALASR